MSKVRRSQFQTFINTDPGEDEAVYAQLGKGITTGAVAANPQVTTEQYISDDEPTTDVDSYQRSLSVEARLITDNDALEYLEALWQAGPPVLDAAVTDIVNVYLYKPAVEGKYPATKHEVAVAFDQYGGDAGQAINLNCTLHYRGNQVPGMFDPETLEFTPTEESE
ncbi:MAG: hypothetical protein KF698_08290 [Anaerolineales bacterium]|nr:hypothetical protein [Anaerolineales bacterium]